MSQTIYDTTPMRQVFKEGTWDVKLSFLVMGLANLVNKQFTKGLLFLFSEIAFLVAFVIQIVPALQGMITLGTQEQGEAVKEVNGVKLTVQVAGDNSMLMLIFGLASLIFCAVFAYIYWCNLKSARHLMALKQSGRKVPNFIEDFKTLADGRFHMGLMTVPLIGVLLFTILPLIYMICLAFTNFDHNHPAPKSLFDWVGFSSFGEVLQGRMAGTFFPLLTWTLIWAVAATATTFFFGIVLALLLNDHGPLNGLLQTLHLTNGPIPFLTDPLWAKFSIIFVNMWIGIPFTMLVATGIIMNLPTEQIEAAEIDGASKFQIFKSITFPQILLIMAPSLIQQFIGNINNFNVIYFLTGGGPTNSEYYQAGSTDLLVTWLYKLTVSAKDYNLASVIGILIFAISATFSLLAYTRSSSFKEGAAK
ncbi:MAG: sugar ABC transporter permease [Streptococcus salivarius]|nr:sugar ABC transporter permease [Streptococcus salivarius]